MTSSDPLSGAARPGLLDRGFDAEGLHALRAALKAHARVLGVPAGDATQHLLMTVAELAANAVTHGGGTGRLRVWREDDRLYCEVSDRGPGFAAPAGAGTAPPGPHVMSGRGLWIIRQLCDQVVIANGPVGTRVTAVLLLSRTFGHGQRGHGRSARDRGGHEHRGAGCASAGTGRGGQDRGWRPGLESRAVGWRGGQSLAG